MKYCTKCGKEIMDDAVICTGCGCAQDTMPESKIVISANDASTVKYSLLGFFIPIVGLILYFVWHDTQPLKAKAAGKGSLISIVISVILTIILTIVGVIVGSTIGLEYIF